MKKAIQLIALLLIVATLAIPASAATTTPSVQQKGAPTVTTAGVTVSAVVDLDKAPAEVKAVMEEAYKVIDEAKSLVEAVPAMAETLKEMKVDVKAENLVVRDVFHVALDKEIKEGEKQEITFKAEGLKKGDFLMVMVFVDGEWVILDAENVEITADGEVKVAFEQVGPVAFVTEQA